MTRREPLNDQSAVWQQWTAQMRAAGRIVPDGHGGELILNAAGQIVGGIRTCTFPDLNAPENIMKDHAKIAARLLDDLSSLPDVQLHGDCRNCSIPNRAMQLILDALEEVSKPTAPVKVCCCSTNEICEVCQPAVHPEGAHPWHRTVQAGTKNPT